MSDTPQFKAAYPYQQDVLALPVADLDSAAQWYWVRNGSERFIAEISSDPVCESWVVIASKPAAATSTGRVTEQHGIGVLGNDFHQLLGRASQS